MAPNLLVSVDRQKLTKMSANWQQKIVINITNSGIIAFANHCKIWHNIIKYFATAFVFQHKNYYETSIS